MEHDELVRQLVSARHDAWVYKAQAEGLRSELSRLRKVLHDERLRHVTVIGNWERRALDAEARVCTGMHDVRVVGDLL